VHSLVGMQRGRQKLEGGIILSSMTRTATRPLASVLPSLTLSSSCTKLMVFLDKAGAVLMGSCRSAGDIVKGNSVGKEGKWVGWRKSDFRKCVGVLMTWLHR